MKTLTIFTPTFNRAYCLHQCYNSLISQNNKNFIWLIIDDGSTDNTKQLVNSWVDEKKIDIIYHYQENQGMHGAHNTAYKLIDTPLNMCIDSDDWAAENAVMNILELWKQIEFDDSIAGIVGLDADKNDNIIGSKIPENITQSTLYDLYNKHHVKGDKKLVYKTAIVKQFPPYPIYKEERFVPLGYLYQLIDQQYKLLTTNAVFCIVEYMEDGSSLNILKQYRRHPKGFAFSRKSRMQLGKSFKDRFKNAIHYVSSSIFNKNTAFISESPRKMLTVLAIPFGVMLHIYILYKTKK
ncbi:glycosyltransferase family 2 protein [Tamlana sp. I1]|uniref:glycosyltransferase family 2 protein n=1 Tax=Tamlana sp. I1 TaxID=2762061 RepID=UPI00188F8B84|nr:glycosyltransferase family 2 protein [Tamlana sp. I1]